MRALGILLQDRGAISPALDGVMVPRQHWERRAGGDQMETLGRHTRRRHLMPLGIHLFPGVLRGTSRWACRHMNTILDNVLPLQIVHGVLNGLKPRRGFHKASLPQHDNQSF